MSDKKPRALSLEEVSQHTGIPLAKLQEQQAARQAQIQSQSASVAAAAAQPASGVDQQPSWYDKFKGMASEAYNTAATATKESLTMVKDLGNALENAGTSNSLANQRIDRRIEEAMKP